MREVTRTSHVDATPEAIWPDLVDGQRFAEWYAFCDEVEEPAPGTRVLLGSWGSQRSAVTTEIVTAEQPTRFAWRHVAEELDGRPAPAVAIDTTVEVVLEPAADGGTDVTITSRQRPRGAVQAGNPPSPTCSFPPTAASLGRLGNPRSSPPGWFAPGARGAGASPTLAPTGSR